MDHHHSPLLSLRVDSLAQGMSRRELLLLHLLPGVELLVGPEEDVLVPQLIDTDAGLGADDRIDAAHLVSHLPGALKTPDVVLAKMISKVPISEMGTVRESERDNSSLSSPAQIWLGVNSVKPFSCPGQFPLIPDTIHLDLKPREVRIKLTELGTRFNI